MLKTHKTSNLDSLQENEPKVWKETNYEKFYLLSFISLNILVFLFLGILFYQTSQNVYLFVCSLIIGINIISGFGFEKPNLSPWAFNLSLLGNFGGFLLLTLASKGFSSPFVYWLLLMPLNTLLLRRNPSIYIWLGLFLSLLISSYLIGAEMNLTWLPALSLEAFPHFFQISLTALLVYLMLFLFIKERYDYYLNKSIQDSREENAQLRKQVQIIDSRNFRLIQLYQNLQTVEKVNEQKTEILTEAARIMDFKNRQIRGMFDDFKEQRENLEESNLNITNSIRYAQRIQEAITPDRDWVISQFRDAFIFYQPKDIVSGDFYWFAPMETEEGSVKILIAADCTGHGVPGAFMTVMGNSIINEIVNEMKITDPSEILYNLDRKILETLSDKDGKVAIHDGMDMAILVINDEKKTVKYAAAHNPLYYVRQQKLKVIKGSKFAVGSSQYRTKKVFDVHTIEAYPGDVFYIFTDGFQDQFGKKEQRKYMTRRFRNFLFSINRLPLCRQGEKVENEFANWKQNLPQTDDVLIIGFRM